MNQAESPQCSVCIANYNGVELIDDCLASVMSQQGEISFEIIVHDDASTDDSVALLRMNYPEVEVLASSENVGFCVANNRMVAHARGKFILLLNNDAALYPDALLTLIETANGPAATGIVTLPQYDWETGALVDRGCLLDLFYNPVPNLDPGRRDVAVVIGACLWMARDAWNEVGGFPEWFQSIGEDMYLCCVTRLRGRPVQVAGASGYRHRQGASFGGNRVEGGKLSTTFRRRRLSERNKTTVMIICSPTWLVWPLLLVHLAELALEGMVVAIRRYDRRVWNEIYGPALGAIFSGVLDLKVRREQQQALRQVSLFAYLAVFTWFPHKLRMLFRNGFPSIH
ncbi:MAG: glycosyltransferase [Burkholderiaceae bacterium]